MLLDPGKEKEFRRKSGIEGLGSYDAVIFRLGLSFEELANFNPSKPEVFGLESLDGLIIYKGRKGGKNIVFTSTLVGAPAASFNIETCLCHSPASMGIGVGYCGGLQSDIEIGKIIIPNKARIGEGTSGYYGKTEFSTPDQQLVKRLLDVTWHYGYEPLMGEVYSIDAPLMESPDFIEKLSREGVLGIDMETSALFSIAEYHGKRAATILVVSDKPHQRPLYRGQAIEEVTEDVIRICIQALAD